ncbi:MAG: hypothetical protein QNJ98_00795 [Planctomycetota bacterium]|nr:hypothetical protein [Planctomycetota bacterium]
MSAAFSRRGLIIVIGVCVTSFVGGMLLMIFAQDLISIESNRFDSFGLSATGHQALYELLDELGIPVFQSTWESGERAGKSGVLVLLQPGEHGQFSYFPPTGLGEEDSPGHQLRISLEAARSILYVLPKWTARPDFEDPEWIADPELMTVERVQQALGIVDVNALIVRPENEDALTWRTGGLGPAPALRHVQLMQTEMLDPIVSSSDGHILVGEGRFIPDEEGDGPMHRLIVVSDPDLFSNHGLVHAQNAELVVRLIELMRRGGGVVIDETSHGHIQEPSFWRELFRMPLALIPLHAVFCVIMLLWVGMRRFGSPQKPPPEIDPGNRYLIRNTADLLRYGGHSATVLRRYLQDTIGVVKSRLHAPPALKGAELAAWFDRVERSRRTTLHYRDLVEQARPLTEHPNPPPERVLRTARMAHEWRQEILHGPASGSERT